MNWNTIKSEEVLDAIKKESFYQKILIFKHSTKCSISSMVLNRLERSWKKDNKQIKPYILDLIVYRNISNKIVTKFKVKHESPQVLVIDKGECVYNASHMGINYDLIMDN